jgi:hypothetical protein
MVRLIFILGILSIWVTPRIKAQSFFIEGMVIDAASKQPIPYASIYNRSLKIGSITNTDGYFKIQTNSYADSVQVIFIGYPIYTIRLQKGVYFYNITMEESPQLLNEIVVRPKDNFYLYTLLMACRREEGGYQGETRAYLELKTFTDKQQIELVEGYYNAAVSGYELLGLQLKTGRVALKPYEDRLFASLESSGVISRMPLFKKNPFFPENPMTVDKKELRKKYDLYLDKKYLDESGDSVYVIAFTPVQKPEEYFEGKIWINIRDKTMMKINFQCPDARKHPFLPLFSTDSISHAQFNITRTYTPFQGHVRLNHIDFTYSIHYKSRAAETHAKSYVVTTQALLYLYEAGHPFMLPRTGLPFMSSNDYRQINAMPYNSFFWQYNTEFRINNSDNRNELFYSANPMLNNESIFGSGVVFKKGMFEQPYVPWSQQRISLKPVALDTVPTPELYDRKDPNHIIDEDVKSDKYRLVVRPFMDINTYADSTDILTAVIFDPFESFYFLFQDERTQCFINIYFDLCEVERRKFMEKINRYHPDPTEINWMFDLFEGQMERVTYRYLKDVDRGTNEKEMIRYNDIVYRNLGIDNVGLIQPYAVKRKRGLD